MKIPFDAIAATALSQAKTLLPSWFAAGRWQGAEFCIGNLQGDAGQSLRFNAETGIGADFATGETFGDIIDLYAKMRGIPLKDAALSLAQLVGVSLSEPPQVPTIFRSTIAVEYPPDDAPIAPETFSAGMGLPTAVYQYRGFDNALLSLVVRWDEDISRGRDRKTFRPYRWQNGGWVSKAMPTPRSLYGLELITAWPDKAAVIVEGEKAADAARTVYPTRPVLTWQGGASAVKHADWSALAKLAEIVIWPDADEPGIEAATELADIARSMGLDVWILDPVELARLVQVGSIPQGYDCADAVATGATRTEIQNWAKQLKIAYRPAAVVQAEVKAARTNEPEDLPTLWAQLGFAMAGKGRPAANLDNAQRALADFLQPADLHYDPFLNLIRTKDNDRLVRLSDEHMLRWTVLIQSRYGITNIQPRTVQEAVFMLAKNRQVNSLQEWLKRQTWDKTRRIDEMLITGFGAADNTFTRAVSRKFLISLAARAMQPGCQVDTMLILEGRQGLGKSRGLEALVGSERYADIDSAIGTRQHTEEIQGKWLVEISELSAFRAGDVERIKAGITRTTDVYREPFARIATDHPRQCVYAGTTNAHQYLLDDTGNRRFWPVRVSRVDRKWLTDHRGQLFAEALHEYLAGSTWWEIDTAEAEYQQQARLIGDALDDAVATVLSGRPGESITVSQILQHLELPLSQWTPQLQKRVVGALRRRGWVDRREAGVRIWSGPETPTGTPESPTGSVVVDIGSAKRRYW